MEDNPKALPHVVTALIAKRSELAGQIEHIQGQLKQAVIDLDNVEATLRLFAPEIDMDEIAPRQVPPAHHAFRGEVSRIILEGFRKTTRPLSTMDLTKLVMRERRLDTGNKALCRTMSRRVGACLRHWRNKGVLLAGDGPGQQNLWRLKD